MERQESRRLGRQTQAIIDRLRRGSATNVELSGMALKYTSRVSDARASGYDIRCRRMAGGLSEYWLCGYEAMPRQLTLSEAVRRQPSPCE